METEKLEWHSKIQLVFTTLIAVICKTFCSIMRFFVKKELKDISSDIVLITGGGKGVGKKLALELARFRPKCIVLWGRHIDTLSETAAQIKEMGVHSTYMVCDVSKRDDIYKKAQEVQETVGHVSILVNNAGVVFGKPLLESDDEETIHVFKVNTLAQFTTIKAFLPNMMRSNHGHIVSVSSMIGLIGLKGAIEYCTSKFSIGGLSESLRHELKMSGHNGITVTCVHPFQIDNDMFSGVKTRFPFLFPPVKEEYVSKKTVEAILRNQEQLIIPRLFYLSYIVGIIAPMSVKMPMFQFLGLDRAMDYFHSDSKKMS